MTDGEPTEPEAIDPDLAEDMFWEYGHAAQSRPVYLPTPDQIAEACRLIQAEWSPAEKYRRSRGITPYLMRRSHAGLIPR